MFRFRKSFFRYIHNFNILTHYFCNCKSSKITLSIIFRSIRKKILSSLSLSIFFEYNISSKRLTIIVHVKICRNIIRSLNKMQTGFRSYDNRRDYFHENWGKFRMTGLFFFTMRKEGIMEIAMVPRCRRLKLNFTRLIYTGLSKRCKSK